MSSSTDNPADVALTAWNAAGIKPRLLAKYQLRWNTWESWCNARDIDPLGATHDEFTSYEADHDLAPKMREQQASALFQPYRYVNKPNPASRPISKKHTSERSADPIIRRFESWCKANGATPLPAKTEVFIAFLTELAETFPKSYLIQARTAIGRMHTAAGYAPPSRTPAVSTALKNLQGTPRQPVTDTQGAFARERRIAIWADWCRAHGLQPEDASDEHFLQFLQLLATTVSRLTLNKYRQAIALIYADHSITHNPRTQALIDATPKASKRTQKNDGINKQADAEIQLILRAEAQTMAEYGSRLPIEKLQRIAQAIAHADVTDKTIQGYIRYAWIPFQASCINNNILPDTANPSDISAHLCEIADEKGPKYADSTFNGLNHIFNRIRPTDNPADCASVRKTLRGLKRERPSPPQQAKPLGTEEFVIIIKAAHIRKPRETEDQARLRASVDIALISTMHDTGIRRVEAATIQWDDLEPAPNGSGGSVLTIRSSKTDQLHEGAVLYLTKFTTDAINYMTQVRQELGLADTEDTRIFRMSAEYIYQRIRAACKHAGLEGRYTSHSPRVGTAQDLLVENFSDAQIMQLHRWNSSSSLAHYTKKAKATKNAVAQREQRRKQEGLTPALKPDNYGIRAPYSKARLGQ